MHRTKITAFIALTTLSAFLLVLSFTPLAGGKPATQSAVQKATGSTIVPITEDAAQAAAKRQWSVRSGQLQVTTPERQMEPDGKSGAISLLKGCTDNTLPPNDDGSTLPISLPFPINYYGTTYNTTFVNNNGNITFSGPLSPFIPLNLNTTNLPIMAPFFTDVDTRGASSNLVQYGNDTLNGQNVFCVNWVDVGYYNSHSDLLNAFQLLLIDRSDTGAGNFDIQFNYDRIVREAGDASFVGSDILGGSSARAGYAGGKMAAGTSYELPGSAVSGSLLDSNPTTGLTNNSFNSGGLLGRYVFAARDGAVVPLDPNPLITVSLPTDNFDNAVPAATIIIEPVMTTLIDPTTTGGLNYVGFQGDFTFDSAVVSFPPVRVQCRKRDSLVETGTLHETFSIPAQARSRLCAYRPSRISSRRSAGALGCCSN